MRAGASARPSRPRGGAGPPRAAPLVFGNAASSSSRISRVSRRASPAGTYQDEDGGPYPPWADLRTFDAACLRALSFRHVHYTSSGLRPSPFSISPSRFRRLSSLRCFDSTSGSPIFGTDSGGDLPRRRSSSSRNHFTPQVYARLGFCPSCSLRLLWFTCHAVVSRREPLARVLAHSGRKRTS